MYGPRRRCSRIRGRRERRSARSRSSTLPWPSVRQSNVASWNTTSAPSFETWRSSSTTEAPASNAACMDGIVFSRNPCTGRSMRAAVHVSLSTPSRAKVWCTPRWASQWTTSRGTGASHELFMPQRPMKTAAAPSTDFFRPVIVSSAARWMASRVPRVVTTPPARPAVAGAGQVLAANCCRESPSRPGHTTCSA